MKRISSPQYILRFDDICPTMNWRVWAEIEAVLVQRQLKPVLAVVPDNQDPVLQVDRPAEDFWDRARAWQDRGWTIALHGFQHRYVSRNAGMIAIRKKSEFAGLSAEQQREKLRRGVEIFQRERIIPRAWIAPGNTFDATTVALLPEFGIRIISGGYFRYPFACSNGISWVPHQLYYFRPAPAGVWTVCYHHNKWDALQMSRLREDMVRYGPNIASLGAVMNAGHLLESKWSAWLCTNPHISQYLIRVGLKLWEWWSAARAQARTARPQETGPQVCQP